MPDLDTHVVRVFTADDGTCGKPLGVVIGARWLSSQLGMELNARLGFGETVFVDDEESAVLRIFTAEREMTIARYPAIGAAWLLAKRLGEVPRVLRPRLAAPVATWQEDGATWMRGSVTEARSWELVYLGSAEEVDALSAPLGPHYGHHEFWSWISEVTGVVRARVFAGDIGVAEDEATGSAAIHLGQILGRSLVIRQGRGSVIRARPALDVGWVDVGGHVVYDGMRTVRL